jgi:hypothetical protein
MALMHRSFFLLSPSLPSLFSAGNSSGVEVTQTRFTHNSYYFETFTVAFGLQFSICSEKLSKGGYRPKADTSKKYFRDVVLHNQFC